VGGGVPTGTANRTIHGSLVALDPKTGDIVWRTLLFEPVLAPISAAPGLVFAVSGHSVLALDADSGAVLWSFAMEATGYGGIAISRGTIYVGDLSGNLYAFSTDHPHPGKDRISRTSTDGGAQTVGRSASLARWAEPFNENGRDEVMKHECVHQHARAATLRRISAALGENQARAKE
jgi:outer membrane protein assembly factor BamB